MEQLKDAKKLEPFSLDQEGKIRAHLDRVLSTRPFAHSQRSRSFLRYVVEESLSGRSSHIKERNIAVELFGKRIDFNPQEDSTVRVAAGDLRKRLLTAYETDFGDGVKIELPVGSYCPKLHIDIVDPEAPFTQPAAPSASTTITAPGRSAPLWLGFAASLFVAVLTVLLVITLSRTEQPLDRIWNTFSGHKQPVLLVLPTPPVYIARNPLRWSAVSNGEVSPFTGLPLKVGGYTGIGAGLGAARFAEQLAKRNQQFTLRFGNSVSYPDVQQAPSILFGGVTSGIGMQMTSSLRFRVVDDTQESRIIDSSDSGRGWTVSRNVTPEAQREGYALITFIRKSESGFPVMIIAGLSPADTQAGAQFVTDRESLNTFAQLAPSKWADQNFQLVLHENIYDGIPSRSTIASWYTW